jgi:hypothetical protein
MEEPGWSCRTTMDLSLKGVNVMLRFAGELEGHLLGADRDLVLAHEGFASSLLPRQLQGHAQQALDNSDCLTTSICGLVGLCNQYPAPHTIAGYELPEGFGPLLDQWFCEVRWS